MRADRIFTAKLIPGRYIVLCDDGEYRTASPALTMLTGPIQPDYVPKRIGRGVEDITDTPEGNVLLNTLNAALDNSPASELARRGGLARSEAKAAASRANGKLGGRPPRIRSIANACAAYIRSEDLTANISDGRRMTDNEYACYIWDQLESYGLHRSDESIVRELADAMERAGLCGD